MSNSTKSPEIKVLPKINERKWYESNWFHIIATLGAVAGIISLVLAVTFYSMSISKPKLTYQVSTDRTKIVSRDGQADLRIFYKGTEVKKDVTAASMVIWNAGRKSVKMDSVLEDLKIKTWPRVKVLKASVVRQTRKIIRAKLDRAKFRKGEIPLNWHILEEKDAFIVHIIYEGGQSVELKLDGTIEEQKSIDETVNVIKELSAKNSVAFFLVNIASACMVWYTLKSADPKSELLWGAGRPLLIVGLVLYIVLSIFSVINVLRISAPINF